VQSLIQKNQDYERDNQQIKLANEQNKGKLQDYFALQQRLHELEKQNYSYKFTIDQHNSHESQ